ncbi:MAG: hypothetical protein GXO71_05865, partial [Caldiserica bacterium]|nr:hypothetical protein [Caldisericota bacterium]
MPKILLKTNLFNKPVILDQKKRIKLSQPIKVRGEGRKKFAILVPLSILNNPDYIFTYIKTPFNRNSSSAGAWHIIAISNY